MIRSHTRLYCANISFQEESTQDYNSFEMIIRRIFVDFLRILSSYISAKVENLQQMIIFMYFNYDE